MNPKPILTQEPNGELLCHGRGAFFNKKYGPDTPFDRAVVPYLVMALCGLVDGVVFYNLFALLSYKSPLLLGMQLAGFLFAFDITPVFTGIHFRRLRQGLSRERWLFWLGVCVFGLAVCLNTALRLITIRLLSLDPGAENAPLPADAAAIAVFGLAMPVITSLGSFLVSYFTYRPLRSRKRRLEEQLDETDDDVRRFLALEEEENADALDPRTLYEDDACGYAKMEAAAVAKALFYARYVSLRFMEKCADPAATNALSQSETAFCTRLQNELADLLRYGGEPGEPNDEGTGPNDEGTGPNDEGTERSENE